MYLNELAEVPGNTTLVCSGSNCRPWNMALQGEAAPFHPPLCHSASLTTEFLWPAAQVVSVTCRVDFR